MAFSRIFLRGPASAAFRLVFSFAKSAADGRGNRSWRAQLMMFSILGDKSKKVLDKRARSKSSMSKAQTLQPGARSKSSLEMPAEAPGAAPWFDLSLDHGGKRSNAQTARSGKGAQGQAAAALKDKDDKPSWDVTETSLWRTVYEDLGKLKMKLNPNLNPNP